MGTDAQVVVSGPGEAATALLDRAVARIEELESSWSRFRPASELSQLGRRACGRPTLVSDHTFLLVQQAAAAWQLTGGRFDPTVADAMDALGYDRDLGELDRSGVDGECRDSAGAAVAGCAGIVLDGDMRAVQLPAGVRLDPGGLGKGLAADIVVAELLGAGATGALVNLGGDLRVGGTPPVDDGWGVAVDDPADRSHQLALVLLRDGAVATSSSRGRRWRRPDGGIAHHVVDPSTGAPTAEHAVTVTVVAGEGWWAEVVATALLVDPTWAPTDAAALVVEEDGSIRPVGPIGDYASWS